MSGGKGGSKLVPKEGPFFGKGGPNITIKLVPRGSIFIDKYRPPGTNIEGFVFL